MTTTTTTEIRKKRSSTTAPLRNKRLAEWEVLANSPAIKEALKLLPANYDFEIPKTIWKILSLQAQTIVLQFPEGLLMYACIISDILHRFTGVEVINLAEVTYGACCVDDYNTKKVQGDLLIHYGHSCLIPVQETISVKILYVFVTIYFNPEHLIITLKKNFPPEKRISILGTVQFLSALSEVQEQCSSYYQQLMIPQVKPLSRGETLGCTAPSLSPESDLFIFLADGRFHMEAAMIRNPHIPAYRYDPYNKVMSLEKYDLPRMISIREQAIRKAKEARLFGVILGTLGHQGNPKILSRLKALLDKQGRRYVTFLMAEVQLPTLKKITRIDAWIQISCPRLSMDWGAESDRPLLNVYEAMVALEGAPWDGKSYPMDYYSNEKSVWSNYH
eukprot:gene8033-8861_t